MTKGDTGGKTRPQFETYFRYSGFDGDEQKNIASIFKGSFLRSLVGWSIRFLFFKWAL